MEKYEVTWTDDTGCKRVAPSVWADSGDDAIEQVARSGEGYGIDDADDVEAYSVT